ncbi:MAG: methyltransferase domain-containing protein [Rhodospirillales bacterium]
MIRLATTRDLIELKAKYRDKWLTEEDHAITKLRDPTWTLTEDAQWGLKQMGSLFCWDAIATRKPKTLLEVGAGYDLTFGRRMTDDQEFWIADTKGFYPQNLLDEANKVRKARFVDTLVGKFHPELPENYFDIVFSVSALEHSNHDMIPNICKDMFRVTKPGGVSAHSIDVHGCYTEGIAKMWFEAAQAAGFLIAGGFGENRWIISPDRGSSVLSESLSRVFLNYEGRREDPWTDPVIPMGPYGTILLLAEKP